MNKIQQLTDIAKQNNNAISIDEILNLCDTKEDYDLILKSLNEKDINVTEEKDNAKILSKEEEYNLFKRYKLKDHSVIPIILSKNEGLVRSFALKYRFSIEANGFEMEDAYQEGRIGVLEAIRTFNADLGYKFSTYAVWYILKNIRKFIYESSKTKITYEQVNMINKIIKFETTFFQKNGYNPDIIDYLNEFNISKEKLNELLLARRSVLSLDCPVGENKEETFKDFIEDDKTKNTYDEIEEKMYITTLLDKIKEDISSKEYEIFRKRYGLDLDAPKTLQELANEYSTTKEYILRVERKVLRKIREAVLYQNKQLKKTNKN